MKSLWSIVSFFAIVHLLALLIFIGWLWRTDRLNGARVQQLRELFAITITEEAERAAANEASSDDDSQAMLTRLSSTEQVGLLTTLQTHEQQSSQRMKDESDMLVRQFEVFFQQTESEREAFELERQGWEEATRAERERKADEQFAQTVQQYESLPPKQGKNMLMELVGAGQRQQAVAYLDAMKPRMASKILKEFKSPPEIILATELLEELRTFGLGTVDSKETSDGDTADNTQPATP